MSISTSQRRSGPQLHQRRSSERLRAVEVARMTHLRISCNLGFGAVRRRSTFAGKEVPVRDALDHSQREGGSVSGMRMKV